MFNYIWLMLMVLPGGWLLTSLLCLLGYMAHVVHPAAMIGLCF